MTPDACLPPALRGPDTTIVPMGGGFSGAGVYRVETPDGTFVLKVAAEQRAADDWRRATDLLQRAAAAGLAPPVVHVDLERRAVVSAFVADRSFPAFYHTPTTHDAAVAELARTLRGVHALAPSPDAAPADPRALVARSWATLDGGAGTPGFVGDAVRRVLADDPPPDARPAVLSHNDVHPSNLVYDGHRLLLLDWDAATPNDPFYDLATVALFLRMDEAACRRLLAAYDGAPVAALPPAFVANRRTVAVLCGVTFLATARRDGHDAHGGDAGDGTRDAAADPPPSLADCYQRMRSGALDIATPDGKWTFGLALVHEGTRW